MAIDDRLSDPPDPESRPWARYLASIDNQERENDAAASSARIAERENLTGRIGTPIRTRTGEMLKMGLLPIPDEVREMHKKIDHIIDRMLVYERLISQLVSSIDHLKSDNSEVKQLSLELQAIKSTLDVVKDSLRLSV
jgi:hypothetical protein